MLFEKLKLLLICFKAYSTIKNNYSTYTAIKHRKTVTKLSKPIKQPIIITQQPNKIKVYTESKAADGMLQLRHILTKNAHNIIQLKLEILKSMMGSLRTSIKNKLFEITKEFKEFKFQQSLRIEFTKNDKVFENKIF